MATEKKRWTFKEKQALSKALGKLPENEHEHIYRIIEARDPATLENCPDGTSIDFTSLRPETLRELEGLIASRSVNTQSEIQENNPAEHEIQENNPAEHEIQENNPAEHEKEESSSKSTSNTRKSPRSKGATGSAENTEEVSIKARLRGTSRKSEASHSK